MFYGIRVRPVLTILRSLITTACLLAGIIAAGTVLAEPVQFNIGKQPLRIALTEFARQSDRELLFSTEVVENKVANQVVGTYEPEDALGLLLVNTGLRFSVTDNDTFLVSEDNGGPNPGNSRTQPTLTVQNQMSTQPDQTNQRTETKSEVEEKQRPMEEVIVTGTNIRGATSASPVLKIGRDDIDKSGVSTTQDLLQRVPQNFNGGISVSNFSISPSGLENVGMGTGVNLRGQGTDASLVLLNGRRISASGSGQFVDISLIPLSAIDRIEVLTDGASAIYGADAVGGVVNIMLRTDYEGSETRLGYGTVTDGGHEEYQASQTVGANWSSGNAIFSYEYLKRTPLDSEDRSFTKDVIDPTYLLPREERHSVFFTGRQNLSDAIELFGTGFYSERDSERFFGSNISGTTYFSSSDNQQYGAVLGGTIKLSESWQADIAGTYSRTELAAVQDTYLAPFVSASVPLYSAEVRNINTLWSLDAKADGSLFALPGGDVKAAIGAHYRKERLEDPLSATLTGVALDQRRTVSALFGEVVAPIVSSANRMPGVERLELSMAVRYEKYDDFGSTINPKFGLLWSPLNGLSLRSTYGTSFRAPQLIELSENNVTGVLLFAPDPSSASGTTLTLVGFGNNADLKEETATTWTVGFDFQPTFIPGLTFGATYFKIDFEDKIESELAFFDIFTNPRYESLISHNPDPSLVSFFQSSPGGIIDFGTGGADPFDAAVYFDGRLRNFATVQTSGLDVNAAYAMDSDIGAWNFGVNASYLFEQLERILPADHAEDLVGTPFHPADLKLRGNIGWSSEGLSANIFANYVDSYEDNRTTPPTRVKSWTTIDLILSYDTRNSFNSALLQDLKFQAKALNLFNENPPYVAEAFYGQGTNFDPDNANALGRFIAFQLTKSW